MRIEHITIWTNHLERMKEFYVKYFQADAGSLYQNQIKQFESCFLCFSSGARIELMHRPSITEAIQNVDVQISGYTHISFACGNEIFVDELTERIRTDGYPVVDSPRHTGDGYYESLVLDPDGNQVEITV